MLAEKVQRWKECLDRMVPAASAPGKGPGPARWSQGQAEGVLEVTLMHWETL